MLKALLPVALSLLFAACSSVTQQSARYDAYAEGDRLEEEARGKKLAFTYEDFVASAEYRTSRDIWRGRALEQYDPQNSRVEVLLDEQRGRLYINGKIAMDFPVCSGRIGGSETPRGAFRITQKEKEYRSNRYGFYVDAQGDFVKGGAVAGKPGPAGSQFKGSRMPYWMRFNGAIGMHVGDVHRQGESHGCVRVPEEACSILFEKLELGSVVVVK